MTPELDAQHRAQLAAHAIVGANQPRQGITQTIPDLQVLCFSCGWMTAGDYTEHLAPLVAEWLAEARERIAAEIEAQTKVGDLVDEPWDWGYRCGIRDAARIARGGDGG